MGVRLVSEGMCDEFDVTVSGMPSGCICMVTAWPGRDEYVGKLIHKCFLSLTILGQKGGVTFAFTDLSPGVRARVLPRGSIFEIT